MYTLVIGNKAYSSWSLRAWLALKATGAPFREELIALDQPDTATRIAAVNPAGRVPVLIDGELAVWESIAIVEYLAERHPTAALWPTDGRARAIARAMAAEMHAGFVALRAHCHMNLRRRPATHPGGVPAPVAADIGRICALWRAARAAHGGQGDFLFGSFGAVDAMFAPVATRFATYALDIGPAERAYVEAIHSHPHVAEWRAAAMREPWVIAGEEVD